MTACSQRCEAEMGVRPLGCRGWICSIFMRSLPAACSKVVHAIRSVLHAGPVRVWPGGTYACALKSTSHFSASGARAWGLHFALVVHLLRLFVAAVPVGHFLPPYG